MFIVKKEIKGKEYFYLRSSVREDGKVKAKTLCYLGKTMKEAEKKAKEYKLKMEKNDMAEENKSESKPKAEKDEFSSFISEAGLIWGPEPEIYGGLAGFYTYGPLGKLLKNKVENSVRKLFNSNGLRELEGPTVMPDSVWEASGHLETFQDRTIKCSKCNAIFRADKIIEEKFDVAADAWSDKKILDFINKKELKCPSCKGIFENKVDTQSLMMKTKVAGTEASLRPETATVTYLPYQRFYNYFKRKLPLGVFQIGKAYRNEISPRQHVLRGREFTQAEGQLFVDPKEKNNWEKFDEIKKIKLPFWDYKDQEKEAEVKPITIEEALKKGLIKSQAYGWCINLAYKLYMGFGIPKDRIRLRQHHPDEKAFYADDAWDIEINLNRYGWTEMCGIHDRTDYDLTQHSKFSGQKLEATRENGEKFTPHVLEIAFGTDRPTYALIDLFYKEQKEQEGKTTFRIPYQMAPIDVSIFPLMKKPELLEVAQKVKADLEGELIVDYNISGSIGKRYLRSATAGTPYAITIDYDSLEKKDVTIRDRDTEEQKRIKIENLKDTLRKLISREISFSDLK
jgi:glycyl-tRNA synthetase